MKSNTERLIQSYVLDKFFISTAYRKCSAITTNEIWYYETIVFSFDRESKRVGAVLEVKDAGENPADALLNHNATCLTYFIKNGGVK